MTIASALRVGERRQILPSLSGGFLGSQHASRAGCVHAVGYELGRHILNLQLLLSFGLLVSLRTELVHLDLLIDVVLRACTLRRLLGCCLLLNRNRRLLVEHSCVLNRRKKLLGVELGKLGDWIGLLVWNRRSVLCDHREGPAIRVIHVANVVVYLQVEGRLVYLDLLQNVTLSAVGTFAAAVRACVRNTAFFTAVLGCFTVHILISWGDSL